MNLMPVKLPEEGLSALLKVLSKYHNEIAKIDNFTDLYLQVESNLVNLGYQAGTHECSDKGCCVKQVATSLQTLLMMAFFKARREQAPDCTVYGLRNAILDEITSICVKIDGAKKTGVFMMANF